MSLLLSLVLTISPGPCEPLWARVWSAWSARVPGADERVGPRWVAECKRFDAQQLACARGDGLEAELVVLRQQLERDQVPAPEREARLKRRRAEWTVLDCEGVRLALDRVTQRQAGDAGVPASDDCEGADLAEGRCRCAHRQCMTLCCREGEACAHTFDGSAKCVRVK